MDMKTWLESCNKINVTNVKVTIGKPGGKQHVYVGCRYQEDYNQSQRLYLCGQPLIAARLCYCMEETNYYVAASYYMPQKAYDDLTPALQAKYHSHGPMFMVFEWTNTDTIDLFEYHRIPMTVEDM